MLHTYYITVSIFIYPYVFEWLLKLWFEYVLFCGIIVNSTLLFLFTAADERVKSVNALYTYVDIFLNIENSAFDHIHVVKQRGSNNSLIFQLQDVMVLHRIIHFQIINMTTFFIILTIISFWVPEKSNTQWWISVICL